MSEGFSLVVCPICGSPQIISMRHDSDWGSGNSCSLVNPGECYEAEYTTGDIGGDIDIYVCLKCNFTWRRFGRNPAQDEISLLREQRDIMLKALKHVRDDGDSLDYSIVGDAIRQGEPRVWCVWCNKVILRKDAFYSDRGRPR